MFINTFKLRLDNCIFDENSSKVLSILDWELSTVGDPISDLAYCCTIYHLPKDFPLIHGMTFIKDFFVFFEVF